MSRTPAIDALKASCHAYDTGLLRAAILELWQEVQPLAAERIAPTGPYSAKQRRPDPPNYAVWFDDEPLWTFDCEPVARDFARAMNRAHAERTAAVDPEIQCPSCEGEGSGFEEGEPWECNECGGSGRTTAAESKAFHTGTLEELQAIRKAKERTAAPASELAAKPEPSAGEQFIACEEDRPVPVKMGYKKPLTMLDPDVEPPSPLTLEEVEVQLDAAKAEPFSDEKIQRMLKKLHSEPMTPERAKAECPELWDAVRLIVEPCNGSDLTAHLNTIAAVVSLVLRHAVQHGPWTTLGQLRPGAVFENENGCYWTKMEMTGTSVAARNSTDVYSVVESDGSRNLYFGNIKVREIILPEQNK
jgi:hypothetical protein